MAQSVAPPWERTEEDRVRIRAAVARTVPDDSDEGSRCEHDGTIRCSDCGMTNGHDHDHTCSDDRCRNDELECSECGGDPTCEHRPVCQGCESEVDYDLDSDEWC
jgi:hypothetical protein